MSYLELDFQFFVLIGRVKTLLLGDVNNEWEIERIIKSGNQETQTYALHWTTLLSTLKVVIEPIKFVEFSVSRCSHVNAKAQYTA